MSMGTGNNMHEGLDFGRGRGINAGKRPYPRTPAAGVLVCGSSEASERMKGNAVAGGVGSIDDRGRGAVRHH